MSRSPPPPLPPPPRPSGGGVPLREVVTTDHLDSEESETHNFNAVAERPPAGIRFDSDDRLSALLDPELGRTAGRPPLLQDRHSSASSSSKTKFRTVARRVQMMQRLKDAKSSHARLLSANRDRAGSVSSTSATSASHNNNNNSSKKAHRKGQASRAHDLLSSLQEEDTSLSSSHDNHHNTAGAGAAAAGTDNKKQQQLSEEDNLFLARIHEPAPDLLLASAGIGEDETKSSSDDDDDDDDSMNSSSDERLPLRNSHAPASYGSASRFVAQRSELKKKTASCWRRFALRPAIMAELFYRRVLRSWFLLSSLPLFASAWILYYGFGNPVLEFLPGGVSLAWWLDFVGRQILTLALAHVSEYLVLECLLFRNHRWLGPLVTMTALQARGWPFVVTAWAGIDLLIFQGSHRFAAHWLYFTRLRIYTQASSGTYILQSQLYLRLLLSAMVAGTAVTVKRVYVSIRFGRRMLNDFKPRLEKLLADMVLLTEISELAMDADMIASDIKRESQQQQSSRRSSLANAGKKRSMSWSNVNFEVNLDDSSSSEDEDDGDFKRTRFASMEPELERSGSGRILLKHLLDSWDEPGTKLQNQRAEATLHDVLKFKRALTYMDNDFPFGEAYGPASDRNQSIASSHSVYWNLIKFTPETKMLSFEVLSIVATDEFGGVDETKMRRLKKMFPPDANNELSLLAFCQSCDAVYKKLRFFRASVSNSSAIDNALESIVDGVFWFILSLLLLSIMNFNPWPILVSITSLLVSVSFALGSSVSKYVEGVLLIAVRRPFDLGDRIIISDATKLDTSRAGLSWFVEEISLFSTTLRFATTNEVSTLNNFSISQARIVNLQRSSSAVVYLDKMPMHVDIIRKNKVEALRAELEQFVKNHPRIWESLDGFRHDEFITDTDLVHFTFAFRHRSSWQNMARIAADRANLLRFIYETAVRMGVEYGYENSPSPKRVLLQGGEYRAPEKAAPSSVLRNRSREFRSADALPKDLSSLVPGAGTDLPIR